MTAQNQNTIGYFIQQNELIIMHVNNPKDKKQTRIFTG